MKKQFKLDEIDCANCARELQDELAKLEGVKSVSVNFMTQKLTLEADDTEFDEVLDRVVEFTADAQTLNGAITVDSISTLDFTLKNSSSFTGTINFNGHTITLADGTVLK